MSPSRILLLLVLLLSSLAATLPGLAQVPNQRLILKDGSYQVVTKYQKVGRPGALLQRRAGPMGRDTGGAGGLGGNRAMGQRPCTRSQQAAPPPPVSPAIPEAAAIDKEEQQERARTPDVSPGLRLPDEEGIWALDTFHDQPELVALAQNSATVDRQTGHNVLRAALNPIGGVQQTIQIPGAKSKVKLHINDPALYVSLPFPTMPWLILPR